MRKLINNWLDNDNNIFKLNILCNIISKLSIFYYFFFLYKKKDNDLYWINFFLSHNYKLLYAKDNIDKLYINIIFLLHQYIPNMKYIYNKFGKEIWNILINVDFSTEIKMILSYRTLNTYFEFFLPVLKDDSFAEEIIAVVYNVSDQMYYDNIDYKNIILQLIEKHYNNNYSFLQKLYSKILLADLRWAKIKILTTLNIVFENCDYVSIPYIKIKQLVIEGVFRRINSASNINSKKLKGKLLTDALYAESILISIFKDINIFCKYNKEISLIDCIKKHRLLLK